RKGYAGADPLRLPRRHQRVLRVPHRERASHPARAPGAGGGPPRHQRLRPDRLRFHAQRGRSLRRGGDGGAGGAAGQRGPPVPEVGHVPVPGGHHHARRPRARHRAMAPAALDGGRGGGVRSSGRPHHRARPRRRRAGGGHDDLPVRLERRLAPAPLVNEGPRRELPRPDHNGRSAQRPRGREGQPQAPRPSLQQGPVHPGRVRDPVPRAVDAGRGPDLPAAGTARAGLGSLPSQDDIFVVVNPASGKGRGARLVEPVLRALREAARGARIGHALTSRSGDEVAVAQQAIDEGYRRLVAVGGDGTWSNVGNAILRSGVDAALGLVAGGTGCDLAKSLDIPAPDVAAAGRGGADGRTRRIDAGTVEGRYFFNVVGFGFDIAVIEDTWKVNYLRGAPLYLYCAVRQLYRFPGFPVELAVDGRPGTSEEMLMLVIANARVFGGGFKVAPRAELGDGQLDLVAFTNMPRRRRFPLMISLLRGTHERAPEVRTGRAEAFHLRFTGPPTYERDGEWNRAGSSEIAIGTRRAALRVLVPADAVEMAHAEAPAPAPA